MCISDADKQEPTQQCGVKLHNTDNKVLNSDFQYSVNVTILSMYAIIFFDYYYHNASVIFNYILRYIGATSQKHTTILNIFYLHSKNNGLKWVFLQVYSNYIYGIIL